METLHLARWETRFWAWLIDFILVGAVASLFSGPLKMRGLWNITDWGIFDVGFQSVVFFLYWTLLEGYRGQSIGKMALNIRVADRIGGKVGYPAAAIQAFGKAFLLPFDCLIGWLAMPGTKLRLFNRLSDTIVIAAPYQEPYGVHYEKEKE
jgi:uncharacterized RDD family membrane protein YckC